MERPQLTLVRTDPDPPVPAGALTFYPCSPARSVPGDLLPAFVDTGTALLAQWWAEWIACSGGAVVMVDPATDPRALARELRQLAAGLDSGYYRTPATPEAWRWQREYQGRRQTPDTRPGALPPPDPEP